MTPNDSGSKRNLDRWGEQFAGLLEAAKSGAEWAWVEFYDAFSPTVLAYLRGRAASEPEDLLGETFLHAVRNISTFQGDERSFRAWLIGIAHRRLVDDIRYRSRRPATPVDDEALLEGMAPAGDVEDEAIERNEVRRALEAIRRLSSDQQDVLLLRLVADLTTEEVASILGKRVTAVKALQRRGLAALQRKISDEAVSQ